MFGTFTKGPKLDNWTQIFGFLKGMLGNQKMSKRFPLTVDGFDVRQPPFPMLDIKDAKIKNCQLPNRKLKQIYVLRTINAFWLFSAK